MLYFKKDYTALSFGLKCTKTFSSGVTQLENKSGSAALSLNGTACETVRDSQRQEVEG